MFIDDMFNDMNKKKVVNEDSWHTQGNDSWHGEGDNWGNLGPNESVGPESVPNDSASAIPGIGETVSPYANKSTAYLNKQLAAIEAMPYDEVRELHPDLLAKHDILSAELRRRKVSPTGFVSDYEIERVRAGKSLAKHKHGFYNEALDEATGSMQHGDIVEFVKGPYHRLGYYRVDTENAVGASQERPWVGDVAHDRGWYVEAKYLHVVLSSSEYDTDDITSDEAAEAAFYGHEDDLDEEYDPLDTAKQVAGPGDTGDELDESTPLQGQVGSLRQFRHYMHKYHYPQFDIEKAFTDYSNEFNLRPDTKQSLRVAIARTGGELDEGYWEDTMKKMEQDREARKGQSFEKNPLSHDEHGVYKGDKDLAGVPVDEMAIDTNPEDPNSPTIHSHKGANAMSLKGRIAQARAQLKELGQMADRDDLAAWQRISKLALGGGMSMGLVQNLEQIEHGIAELSAKRSKGGVGSRGIETGIDEAKAPQRIKVSKEGKTDIYYKDPAGTYIKDGIKYMHAREYFKKHPEQVGKQVNETIAKVKGGYEVKSHTGKNLGGPYPSKKQAAKRLGQVEYFKHAKEDVSEGSDDQLKKDVKSVEKNVDKLERQREKDEVLFKRKMELDRQRGNQFNESVEERNERRLIAYRLAEMKRAGYF